MALTEAEFGESSGLAVEVARFFFARSSGCALARARTPPFVGIPWTKGIAMVIVITAKEGRLYLSWQ
jgi:hypothetical protein